MLRAVYQSALTAPTLPSGTAIPPSAAWSETPPIPTGDEVVWITLTYADDATSATGSGFWTPVGQWGGTRGSDGIDGQIIRTVYKLADTAPVLPVGTLIPPATWSETPPKATVGFVIWASSTWAANDTTPVGSGTWTPVGQWSGANGNDGKVIRGVYRVGVSKPTDPSGTAIPPLGWYENPPTPTIDELVWASYSYSDTDTSANGSGRWTVAAKWSGYKGADGADGIDATERYTWVKYADDELGNGLDNDPVGKLYIGIAYNQVTPTEGTNPLAYAWSLIKGTDGDTIYTQFQFSADQTNWHFPEQTGDFYLRSREVNNGVNGPWGTTTVIRGSDGLDGVDATNRYTWIKYADDANGNGLVDDPLGKIYIGIAYNKTSSVESGDPSLYAWSKVQGNNGGDGSDGSNGDTIYTQFEFSADALNWHFPEENGDRYIHSQLVTNGVGGGYGNTTLIVGADGLDGNDGADGWQAATVFLFRDSATHLGDAQLPVGNNLYRFSTGLIETSIGNSWFQDVPTNLTGKLWVTTATASATATVQTDIIPDTEWATPKLWVTDGADGSDGAGWYSIVARAGVFPSNTEAKADFLLHTGRSPVEDDHFTYLDDLDNPTVSEVKRFDGSVWLAPSQIINGDLLVKGTITGDRLVANTIKGDNISVDTTIIAGVVDETPSFVWVRNSINVTVNEVDGVYDYIKTSGTNDTWDSGIWSRDIYKWGAEGIRLETSTSDNAAISMIGFTDTVINDPNYGLIDYAMYFDSVGNVILYIAGVNSGNLNTYTTSDVFAMTYQGDYITFLKNDVAYFTLIVGEGRLFGIKSSSYRIGKGLNNVKFYPVGSYVIPAVAGMNGVDDGTGTGVDGIRLWSGSVIADAQSAPFRVAKDGALTATGATISGDITADTITAYSGALNNVVINESCTILGTLTADKIIGDIYNKFRLRVNNNSTTTYNVTDRGKGKILEWKMNHGGARQRIYYGGALVADKKGVPGDFYWVVLPTHTGVRQLQFVFTYATPSSTLYDLSFAMYDSVSDDIVPV